MGNPKLGGNDILGGKADARDDKLQGYDKKGLEAQREMRMKYMKDNLTTEQISAYKTAYDKEAGLNGRTVRRTIDHTPRRGYPTI